MVVPMNQSDAKAVRHLLTATQRSISRQEDGSQGAVGTGTNANANANTNTNTTNTNQSDRYHYRFDDFEGFDEDSDDERDFRDLSHYASIDPISGRVKELWLGIIDFYGSRNNSEKYWTLCDNDWEWLVNLDQLEHIKLSGCGGLPHRQLERLPLLKHMSCSECGNLAAGDNGNVLSQVRTFSLRCGFQPTPCGIDALKAVLQWMQQNLPGLEKITVWRLDQQQHGRRNNSLSAYQRKENKRRLVETLLEGLSECNTKEITNSVTVLELNRCGITSEDFRRLVFDILPNRFPLLQRLSLSSNEIDELPRIRVGPPNNYNQYCCDDTTDAALLERSCQQSCPTTTECDNNNVHFAKTKHHFRKLRRSLKQLHLSNNPIFEFLGKNGDEHLHVLSEVDVLEHEGTHHVRDEERRSHGIEEATIVRRRFRRIVELEKLRDLLCLFPRLSHLGYASCVHNILRSSIGDFVKTIESTHANASSLGEQNQHVIPFSDFSRDVKRDIEYYLRVNRGGRWLVEGGGKHDGLLDFLGIWPDILEWSYRTSSGGCFLASLAQHTRNPVQQHMQSYYNSSLPYSHLQPMRTTMIPSTKNATALYHLLREGPALCGRQHQHQHSSSLPQQ